MKIEIARPLHTSVAGFLYFLRYVVKEQSETPKFAHLQYQVLKDFNLSPAEYWYLDMIYYLSREGWCYKSLDNIASDMNMTKNGVVKLRDRLIDKKLVIKNRKGYVKSSVMYNKVYLTNPKTYHFVTNRTTKYNDTVQLSSTKNNNEINIDSKGYKKAQEARDKLAAKLKPTQMI